MKRILASLTPSMIMSLRYLTISELALEVDLV